jgi:hypothetical protein
MDLFTFDGIIRFIKSLPVFHDHLLGQLKSGVERQTDVVERRGKTIRIIFLKRLGSVTVKLGE